MEYPHRQWSLNVNNVDPTISRHEIDAAVDKARKELEKLGAVEVIHTPESYMEAI